MALRTLESLIPECAAKAREMLRLCELANIDLLIYCTYRTFEEQEAEYAKGRTVAGKIVTNAKGGDSYHNWGRAFDCVGLVNGRAQWGDNELYAKIGAIGKSIGLEWGGDWKFKDRPHFQYTEGKTIAMIRKDGNL